MSFSQWNKTCIGNEIELIYGRSLPKTKRIEGEYPVYGSGGITGAHNEALVKGPGIIVGRKGTVGSIYYENKDYFPIDTVYYIKESHKYDLKFMYYFLKTQSLDKMNSHSAVPGLNREEVYKKEISIPQIKEQKAIANILSSLDEKIELNNQMNKTLEEMAQTLFKRWFVDFEFPNEDGEPYKSSGGEMVDSQLGMIPKGWDVGALDQIAEFLNGLAMQKFRPTEGEDSLPVLKIKELNQGKTDSSSDRCKKSIQENYIINDGDIIFSWSGSLNVKIWCGGQAGLNQHLFKVTSSKYPKWFYYMWIQQYLETFIRIAADKATTMGHIKRQHLSDAKVLIPNKRVLESMNNQFICVINKVIELNIENRTLVNLRDTLLPKLMSGDIRVLDIEN